MYQHITQRTFISRLRSPIGLVLCGFLALGALYLALTYTALVVRLLPYGLILVCPLLHLFMHRGHGGHGGHGADGQQE